MNTKPLILVRQQAALRITGDTLSVFNRRRKAGVIPQPVPLGLRCVAWIEAELFAVNRMVAAGFTEDRIRQEVAAMVKARKNLAKASSA